MPWRFHESNERVRYLLGTYLILFLAPAFLYEDKVFEFSADQIFISPSNDKFHRYSLRLHSSSFYS
jgi:hypothetical protein